MAVSSKPTIKIRFVSRPKAVTVGDKPRRKARPPGNFFARDAAARDGPPLERRVARPPAVDDLKRQSEHLDLSHWARAPLVVEGDVPDMAASAAADRDVVEAWRRGAEYVAGRRSREELVEARKAERIRDVRLREAERVREELAAVELRRRREEEAEARRLEEEADAAKKRRAEAREHKRRERARLARTVDLDKDRIEVDDFLTAYGGGANVVGGAYESLEDD